MAYNYSDPNAQPANSPDPGAGAGASSSGSSASSSSKAAASAATSSRVGEIYDSIVIRPLGANGAQPGENYRVPPGYHVEVWPQPSNVGNFFVANGPTQVAAGPREAYLPGSAGRAYPAIKNIASLWFRFANAADEAVVRIVR